MKADHCSVCGCRWPIVLDKNTTTARMSFVYYGGTCSKECARIAFQADRAAASGSEGERVS
jgi:hypothetical protein